LEGRKQWLKKSAKGAERPMKPVRTPTTARNAEKKSEAWQQRREIFLIWDTLQERKKQMSERMIIDALPVRNNILLGIMETKTGNVVVNAMI
jgi:hypothetical protein